MAGPPRVRNGVVSGQLFKPREPTEGLKALSRPCAITRARHSKALLQNQRGKLQKRADIPARQVERIRYCDCGEMSAGMPRQLSSAGEDWQYSKHLQAMLLAGAATHVI